MIKREDERVVGSNKEEEEKEKHTERGKMRNRRGGKKE